MSHFITQFSLGEGPLTVAVKDTFAVAGYPTQAGSAALSSEPARTHATVVERLLASEQYRLVGKTVMHELAFGVTGINAWAGTPENPRYPELIPGGSSSGSATAVVTGEVVTALGTDTGGSVRMPAACCGVLGLKPTFGRVSREGVLPAQSSLDCVGPLAATVDELERVMAVIDPTYRTLETASAPPRLAVVATDSDADIQVAMADVLSDSGARTEPVTLSGIEAAFVAGLAIINRETWQAFGHLTEGDQLGADVRQRLLQASATTDDDVAQAEAVRQSFRAEVDAVLATVDALVLPTLPRLPLRLAAALAGETDLTLTAHVRPFNLTGHPALTLPIGEVRGGPVGLQLVGRQGEDEALCRTARALMQNIPHWRAAAATPARDKTGA